MRNGLFVLVGDGAVLVEVVIGLKPRVARLCRHGPAVGAGGMVHDKIQTQADACLAQFTGLVFKVFVGAVSRVYGIEILHLYEDRTIPDQYEQTVPQVFPNTAPGNFTWCEEMHKWVLTTNTAGFA